MQKWRRLFWRMVLGHFGLTMLTGAIWTALMSAVGTSHHASAVVRASYASFYLFSPFSQPFFWPLSDWAAHSGHFNFFGHSLLLQFAELAVIAFINSLSAVVMLLGTIWIVQFARSYPRKSPAA